MLIASEVLGLSLKALEIEQKPQETKTGGRGFVAKELKLPLELKFFGFFGKRVTFRESLI
jgi:hypothetical protein